jgi:hypothetical protein
LSSQAEAKVKGILFDKIIVALLFFLRLSPGLTIFHVTALAPYAACACLLSSLKLQELPPYGTWLSTGSLLFPPVWPTCELSYCLIRPSTAFALHLLDRSSSSSKEGFGTNSAFS